MTFPPSAPDYGLKQIIKKKKTIGWNLIGSKVVSINKLDIITLEVRTVFPLPFSQFEFVLAVLMEGGIKAKSS